MPAGIPKTCLAESANGKSNKLQGKGIKILQKAVKINKVMKIGSLNPQKFSFSKHGEKALGIKSPILWGIEGGENVSFGILP